MYAGIHAAAALAAASCPVRPYPAADLYILVHVEVSGDTAVSREFISRYELGVSKLQFLNSS
jgi:hypothetical protein